MRVRRVRGVTTGAERRPTAADRCAICRGPGGARGLFLDHDHRTGAARGWLCGKCNTAVGLLNDDPYLFESAKRYLTLTDD